MRKTSTPLSCRSKMILKLKVCVCVYICTARDDGAFLSKFPVPLRTCSVNPLSCFCHSFTLCQHTQAGFSNLKIQTESALFLHRHGSCWLLCAVMPELEAYPHPRPSALSASRIPVCLPPDADSGVSLKGSDALGQSPSLIYTLLLFVF